MGDERALPFLSLDFLYTPSRDVPGDLAYFSDVLGGRVLFAIDSMGTKVATIELTEGPPRDPARPDLLVPHARRTPDRAVSADETGGRRALRGPSRLLIARSSNGINRPA